jgi:hypothetical protein
VFTFAVLVSMFVCLLICFVVLFRLYSLFVFIYCLCYVTVLYQFFFIVEVQPICSVNVLSYRRQNNVVLYFLKFAILKMKTNKQQHDITDIFLRILFAYLFCCFISFVFPFCIYLLFMLCDCTLSVFLWNYILL